MTHYRFRDDVVTYGDLADDISELLSERLGALGWADRQDLDETIAEIADDVRQLDRDVERHVTDLQNAFGYLQDRIDALEAKLS